MNNVAEIAMTNILKKVAAATIWLLKISSLPKIYFKNVLSYDEPEPTPSDISNGSMPCKYQ